MSDGRRARVLRQIGKRRKEPSQTTTSKFRMVVDSAQVVGTFAATGALIYAALTFSADQRLERKRELHFIHTELVPKISIENYRVTNHVSALATLHFDVENKGASTVGILALNPRMFSCDGNEVNFSYVDGNWLDPGPGGKMSISFDGPLHPKDSAFFPAFSKDKGRIVITSLGEVTEQVMRESRINMVAIVEFRFLAFSDLAWRFASELSELYEDDTPYDLAQGSDRAVLPYPPVSSQFSVPRAFIIENGVMREAPRSVCRKGIDKLIHGN